MHEIEYLSEAWARGLAADIDAARSSVVISALSMLVPKSNTADAMQELWQALCRAAARGVRVSIYLAAPNSFAPASRCNIDAARKCSAERIECILVPGPRLLHAKTAVVDGCSAWVGSGNLTRAAATHNHEIWLHVRSPDIAGKITARLRALR